MKESLKLQRCLEAIEARHPAAIELGLDRVRTVAGRMGLLPTPMPVVLVGGTNGKGSTLAFLEGALTHQKPLRIGAYTSPHLFRFNERIRIQGMPVGDPTLLEALEAVEAHRGEAPLTYFEYTTLAAMWVFQGQVDIALLEVGLGGRLDAVNIWEPIVSVITSIDLDHQAYLGCDREAIGSEKAGILRPGIPAVCGDREPPHSLLQGREQRLYVVGRDFQAIGGPSGSWYWVGWGADIGPLPAPRLAGSYQLRNAATALAAGELLPPAYRPGSKAWQEALRETLIPGRGQRVEQGVSVWLDVAHNPGAAQEFATLLEENPVPGRSLAVCGAMRDKDIAGIATAMAGAVDRWYPCGVPGPRGLSGRELAQRLPVASPSQIPSFGDPRAAFAAARAEAVASQDRVVVLGGFPVVAAALEALEGQTD